MVQRRRDKPSPFLGVRRAEREYARGLRKIALHIDHLVRGIAPESVEDSFTLSTLLTRYAEALRPWAKATASRMLADVQRRDLKAWQSYSTQFGKALEDELRSAPTGMALQQLLDDQVNLITSLPTEAAQRVHKLVLQGMATGTRAGETAKDILRTGEVTRSRANLIARTETARAGSALVMVRSQAIGSPGYTWMTMGDRAVRPSHKAMNGKFVRWDTPPEVDPGKFYHAGQVYNCRCQPLPVIPT